MANIDELNQWCKDARKLLNSFASDGPKTLTKNTETVAALLKKIEPQAGLYPDYQKHLKAYEQLATRAHWVEIHNDLGDISSGKARDIMKAVSQDLRRLAMALELDIGRRDPTPTAEQRKAVVEAARHQPVYQDKRARIQAAIDELSVLPGTADSVRALQSLLDVAVAFEPDYQAAYQKLSGLTKNLETGRKDAATFAKEGGGAAFQEKVAELRTAIDEYEATAGMADPTRAAAERTFLREQLVQLEAALRATPRKPTDALARSLVAHRVALVHDRATHAAHAENVRKQIPKINELILALRATATPEVIAVLFKRFDAAAALNGSQQHKAALDAFAALQPDLEAAVTEAKAAKAAWEAVDAKLTQGLAVIEEALAVPLNVNPSISSVASQLKGRITGELRLGLVGSREYAKATATVADDRMLEDIATLGQMVADWKMGLEVRPTFDGDFGALQAGIEAAGRQLAVQRRRVAVGLDQLAKAGGHIEPFEARIGPLTIQWQAATGPIVDTTRAKTQAERLAEVAALAPLASTLSTAMGALADEIAATAQAGSPALAASQQALKSQDDKPAYLKARSAAVAALRYLDEFALPDNDPVLTAEPTLAGLRQAVERLDADAAANRFEIARMEKISSDAVTKRRLIEHRLAARRTASAQTVAALQTTIAGLRKTKPAYVAYYDGLADRLTEHAGLAASTVVGLMEQGEAALQAFQQEVDAQVAGAGAQNFDAVDARRQELQKRLDAKLIKQMLPARQAALSTELEKVFPTRSEGLSPQAALALLADLAARVAALEAEAEAGARRAEAVKTTIRDLKTQVGAITDAPLLKADLAARIAAAGKLPDSQVADAEQALRAVSLLVTAAADAPRRASLNDKAASDAQVAALDKANFDASVDVFSKHLQREAKAVHDGFSRLATDRNDTLHDQISKHLDDAVKDGKTGNYAAAREKLRLAEASARLFIANPYQPHVAARKAVTLCSNAWKAAVGAYLKDLLALKAAIVAANANGEKASDAELQAALDALAPLNTLFNPAAFEHPAAQMQVSPKSPAEAHARVTTKELALMHVQRLQRVLAENRLVQTAAENPFKNVPTAPLMQALQSVNGAFLAS